MKSLGRSAGSMLSRVSDVLGTTIATVVVFVLFAQQYSRELADYTTELYVLMSVMLVASLLSPFISHRIRARRLYILGFAHAVWVALLLLSGVSGAYVVSVNLGLIILTSLWLDAALFTIGSALLLSSVSAFTGEIADDQTMFTVGTQLLLGFYLAQRQSEREEKKRHARDKLSESQLERERLQTLINSMADGVLATDEKGRVVLYNGATLDLLNVNTSLEHKHLSEFLKLTDSSGKPIDIFAKAQKAKAYFISRDYRLETDPDDFMNVFTSIAPVRIGYGKKGERGYIMLIRDITREKSLEEERDEFISVISHELRTPVTISEGNLSNLKILMERTDRVNDKMREAVTDAHEGAVFLAEMINDLSTLSRAERGVLHVEPETIDPGELVGNLVREYEIEAKQHQLKLTFENDPAAAHIVTSRLYVREILQNFITNAIKYTEEGSITVKLDPIDEGSIKVSVKDTGIGISRSDQKKLFEKFFRSEDYRTRKNTGTGLGLYVTKKLADLIKAEIDVDSGVNKGSTFSITIPTLEKPHKS